MRKSVLVAMFAASVMLAASAAADETKVVGNWAVSIDKDRFTGDPKVIALTMQDGVAFGVRCLQKSISMAMIDTTGDDAPYTVGQMVAVKFKADNNAVVNTVGDALNAKTLEIFAPDPVPAQLLTAKEYALRVIPDDGPMVDHVIEAGAARRALPYVMNACPKSEE